MALVDLWNSDRNQVTEKRIDQLIAFAGDGKLRDGHSTSFELRALLGVVPSDVLGQWIDQCLDERFPDFGFVLQDIVNEIGRRLNFDVTHGVYPKLAEYLDDFFTSPNSTGGILHWHVRFEKNGGRIQLMTNRDQGRVDVTAYLLK